MMNVKLAPLMVLGGLSLVGLSLVNPGFGFAADDPKGKPSDQVQAPTKPPATTVGTPVYKPPKGIGTPGGRVGGATRGPAHESFILSVLAPDHTGQTMQEQPSLYWYLSKPTSTPFELTLIEEHGVKPLLETQVRPPSQAGVQRVRLADHGVRLSPGVKYQWFVTLVLDPDRRSQDILAGGTIERIAPPEALNAQLTKASKAEAASLFAGEGLWYDAVTAISDLIEATPNDQSLRKQRASLLEQGGLPEIAKHDLMPTAPK